MLGLRADTCHAARTVLCLPSNRTVCFPIYEYVLRHLFGHSALELRQHRRKFRQLLPFYVLRLARSFQEFVRSLQLGKVPPARLWKARTEGKMCRVVLRERHHSIMPATSRVVIPRFP